MMIKQEESKYRIETKAPSVLRVIAAIAISCAILVLLFLKIDARKALALILHSDPLLICLACAISLSVNIFLGAAKWNRILRSIGCAIPFRKALAIRSGCIPLKIIFPLKSSELLKALYLQRDMNLPFARGVGSILLDKALNLLVVMVIFLSAISFVDSGTSRILPLTALSLIVILLFSRPARNTLFHAAGSIHPKLHNITQELLSSFEEIGLKEKGILVLYTVVYQLSEFVNTYLIFKAVGVPVPFYRILVVVPIMMLVNNFPITMMGFGTREALSVFLFAAYGPASGLLGAGMLVSLIEYVLPVLFGLFFIRQFLACFAMRRGHKGAYGFESNTHKSKV